MPKARGKRVSCQRKNRYDTREAALRWRDTMIARGAAAGSYGAYQCRFCEGWHIGHRWGSFHPWDGR